MRNERGDIKIDTIEVKRILKDYYQQLYTNKLDNLGDMDTFPEIYNLSRQNYEEVENLNRPKTNKEIESVLKIFPKK